MGPSTPTLAGFVSVQDAAEVLGVKPWDVVRLVQTGDLQSVVLIDADSLAALKEKS